MTSDMLASGPLRRVEQAEIKLVDAIAEARRAPATRAAAKVAKLGDQEPLYAVAALLTVSGLLLRKPIVARAGVRMAAAVCAADMAKSLIKATIARSRPRTVIDENRYVREAGAAAEKKDQSFPSGHVACTLAAARALGRVEPRVKPLLRLVIGGLGISRVAEGAHWPSDVAAGLAVGYAAEAVSSSVIRLASQPTPLRWLA